MNKRFAVLMALAVLAAIFCYLPSWVESLGYFDWPKRVMWAVMAVGVFALRILKPNDIPRDRILGRIGWLVVGLTGWMILRSLCRPIPWVEMETLSVWLLPLLAFSAGTYGGPPSRLLILAVGGGVLAQALVMVLQYWGHDPLFSATTSSIAVPSWRMIGTIGYQNQAAAFVAIGSGFVALWMRNRPFALLLSSGSLALVALTGCRGATAAAVIATAVGWTIKIHRASGVTPWIHSLRLFLVVALIACGFVAAHPVIRSRLLQLTDSQNPDAAISSRLRMAGMAGKMWIGRPLTGWGAGAFAHQYLVRVSDGLPDVKTAKVLQELVLARQTHNDYLQFGAEFGFVGLVLAVTLFLILWWRALRRKPAPDCPNEASARASMAFVLSYMTIHSLVSFPWQMAAVGPFAGLLLGVALCGTSPLPLASVPWRMDWAAGGLAVEALLVLFLAVECVRLDHRVKVCTDSGEAWAMARELRDIRPWTYRQRAILGARLAANGEFVKAESVLKESMAGFKDTGLLNNLGYALGRSGQWQEASAVYGVWARTGLNYERAMWNWIAALQHCGHFAEAAGAMEQLMRYWNPNDPRLRDGDFNEKYVYLLMEGGRTDQALSRLLWLRDNSGSRGLPLRLSKMLEQCQFLSHRTQTDAAR